MIFFDVIMERLSRMVVYQNFNFYSILDRNNLYICYPSKQRFFCFVPPLNQSKRGCFVLCLTSLFWDKLQRYTAYLKWLKAFFRDTVIAHELESGQNDLDRVYRSSHLKDDFIAWSREIRDREFSLILVSWFRIFNWQLKILTSAAWWSSTTQ